MALRDGASVKQLTIWRICITFAERVHAWLLSVYFLSDPHSPTTLEEWHSALSCANAELGIKDMSVSCAVEVFLEARERGELRYARAG